MTQSIDFTSLMEPVANHLFAKDKPFSQSINEIRYGKKGSLCINLVDATWFSHEEETGGGVLDLVQRETGENPLDWLKRHCFIQDETPSFAHLGKPKSESNQCNQTYVYTNESGDSVYRVQRYYSGQTRKFSQQRFEGGQWVNGLKGVEPLPYNLKYLADRPDDNVVIVEGEKDADNLMGAGIIATCNSGGAGKWDSRLNRHFTGRNIIVIPDNDNAGRHHADKLVSELSGVVKSLRILDLAKHWPEAPEKADVSDYMAAGGDLNQLMELALQQTDLQAKVIDAEPVSSTGDTSKLLPDYPKLLLNLPKGLGVIQDWIYSRQIYPSRAIAGIAALSTITALAQRNITVDSYGGLGLNEYYMVLGRTGIGKDSIRTPLTDIKQALDEAHVATPSAIQMAAPASPQGLHKLLEEDNAQMFVADEFAEWLRMTSSDSSKQATIGYLMVCYSSANNKVSPGHAVKEQYTPVQNPRVSILATSTAEAMLESMTLEHADSGAYNRWVMFCGDQEMIPKRYDGIVKKIPEEVLAIAKWVANLKPQRMAFTPDAWEVFKELDSTHAEPLKFKDPHLAGRLGEQAIKMAALIALSDNRVKITDVDMADGFLIRLGLYERAAAMAQFNGAFSGLHKTGQALEQVRSALEAKPFVYKSQLASFSRKYQSLSLPEQNAVLAAMVDSGMVQEVIGSKAMLKSNLYCGD